VSLFIVSQISAIVIQFLLLILINRQIEKMNNQTTILTSYLLMAQVTPIRTESIEQGDKVVRYTVDGKLHRTDGPALIRIDEGGTIEETWYENGVKHRENGAAYTIISSCGDYAMGWYFNNESHRIGAPSYIAYNADGSVGSEYWRQHDKLHRDDGAAMIFYNSNGNTYMKWFCNDKLVKEVIVPSSAVAPGSD
jgi:hypothetical protein